MFVTLFIKILENFLNIAGKSIIQTVKERSMNAQVEYGKEV